MKMIPSVMVLLMFLMFVGVVAVAVILPIFLINLARDIRELKRRMITLEASVEAEAGRSAPTPTPAEPSTPIPQPPVLPTAKPFVPAPKKKKADWDLEALIGGNWLNRIGILAVFFATGFFLKYAFENQWIGETGRVAIGLIAGLIFLGLGEWYRAKGYRYFSQGLSGGGIGILFLSIYAAFGFYHLIPHWLAFLFMILVTTAGVVLAVFCNALPIAMLATMGGFLTPFLLSTGVDNQAVLFTYILLLNLGILGVAYFRNWHQLNYQNFIFTIITFAAWAERFYAPSKLWPTVLFLTLFFIVFAVLAILYNILNRSKATAPELILAFLNAGIYFASMYFLLDDKYGGYLGLFSLAMGGIYIALAYLANVRNGDDRFLVWVFLGLAATFVTLAVPIQLEQNWITVAWAVEGAILVYIGFRYESRNTQMAALVLFALVFFRLLGFDLQFPYQLVREDFSLLFNKRVFSFLVGIAAFLFAAHSFAKDPRQVLDGNKITAGCLLISANLLAIILLSAESHDFLQYLRFQDMIPRSVSRYAQQLSLSMIWALYATFLIVMGIWKKYTPLRYMALLLFGITILKVFIIDLSTLEILYRIISFLVLGLLLIAVSYLYQKYIVVLIESKAAEGRIE